MFGWVLDKSLNIIIDLYKCQQKFQNFLWNLRTFFGWTHNTRPVTFIKKTFIFIKKETPTQLFSCELWEIFRNTFLQITSS